MLYNEWDREQNRCMFCNKLWVKSCLFLFCFSFVIARRSCLVRLHTNNFPVPAADSVIDSMEAKVHFEQICHLIQMMLLRRIRHQGRLLMLHVESVDQMDQLVKRQIVVNIAGIHQVLEDVEVLESSQAASFQFQNQIDSLESSRRDTRLGDSDSRTDAALQALDATLVVLLEKQRPESNNGHDTIILESTGLGIESNIRGALLLANGE